MPVCSWVSVWRGVLLCNGFMEAWTSSSQLCWLGEEQLFLFPPAGLWASLATGGACDCHSLPLDQLPAFLLGRNQLFSSCSWKHVACRRSPSWEAAAGVNASLPNLRQLQLFIKRPSVFRLSSPRAEGCCDLTDATKMYLWAPLLFQWTLMFPVAEGHVIGPTNPCWCSSAPSCS